MLLTISVISSRIDVTNEKLDRHRLQYWLWNYVLIFTYSFVDITQMLLLNAALNDCLPYSIYLFDWPFTPVDAWVNLSENDTLLRIDRLSNNQTVTHIVIHMIEMLIFILFDE